MAELETRLARSTSDCGSEGRKLWRRQADARSRGDRQLERKRLGGR